MSEDFLRPPVDPRVRPTEVPGAPSFGPPPPPTAAPGWPPGPGPDGPDLMYWPPAQTYGYPGGVPPLPAPSRALPWAFVGVGLGVLVAVGVGVFLYLGGFTSFGGPVGDGETLSAGESNPPFDGRARTSAAPPPVPASAQERLAQQVATDAPAVEQLTGYWVPQLSSKTVGTVDDGITYDAAAILAHYESVRSLYPDALLLASDRFSTFKLAGHYVIVVPLPYTGADQAISWCVSQGIGRDDCLAKRLAHTGGPQGNTVYQG